MTGLLWLAGAIHVTPSQPLGTGSDFPDAGNRCTHHSTEGLDLAEMVRVLMDKHAETHLVADPFHDRVVQFGPFDHFARALENDGSNRINRTGRIHIQIEWCAFAAHPFTATWNPGPVIGGLARVFDSWGIPWEWPSGPPPPSPNGPFNRSRTIWYGPHQPGHDSHGNAPANSHTDPGKLDPDELFRGFGHNQEDPMPTPEEYAKAVWNTDASIDSPTYEAAHPTNTNGIAGATFAENTLARLERVENQLSAKASSAEVASVASAVAELKTLIAPPATP